MRRPRSPTGAWPSDRQRRPHRGRIGVVALVDQSSDVAARTRQREALAAARRAASTLGQRQASRASGRAPSALAARQARQAVHAPCAARAAEAVGRPACRGPAPRRCDMFGLQDQPASCATSASSCSPKVTMRPRATPCACPQQPLEMRVVAVEHGRAAGLEPDEDLGLGVGDGLDDAEVFQMHRLDGGDRARRAGAPCASAA